MHLQNASDNTIPPGLLDLLRELGEGESGFGGTSFGRGTATLDDFLRACRDGEHPATIPDGFVPQSIFWMIDDAGRAVGMVRVRHRLNDHLLQHGGHVGYYVRPADRGRGHATAALRQAVTHLRTIGVTRVLVTANPTNAASIRTILANGGVPDGQGRHPTSGETVNRYWIDAST